MAKDPLKKTKGLYVGEPQEKPKGTLKKVVLVSAVTLLAVGMLVGAFFGGKAFQKAEMNRDQEQTVQVDTVKPGPSQEQTQKPGSGEVKGDVQTEDVVMMEESQLLIASKLYTDLRADIDHDVTSIDIVGSKLVTEGAETYLQAYISVAEKDDKGADVKAMYVVGYADITEVEDIPDAQVRTVKAGTVADIQKYISIENYLENGEQLEKAKEFIEGRDSIEGVQDLYVRVSSSNL